MDAKRIKESRRRLSTEHENLIKSINRNRAAMAETRIENTDDEGDLATISHERELLRNLHASNLARLKFVQQAMKAIDGRQYGECARCREDINQKRLDAVPWTTMCLRCQEETEAEQTSSHMVLAGVGAEDTEF
jgi:DnaK suppressor protein